MGYAYQSAGGGCICCCSSYCFSNSCESCGMLTGFSDPEVTFYGTPFGHNSLHSITCFDGNHYGYHISQFQVSSETGKCQANSCCCYMWDSGACCGYPCRAELGHRKFPGAGGTGTHAMGGAAGICGDFGRTGMAKVSWC